MSDQTEDPDNSLPREPPDSSVNSGPRDAEPGWNPPGNTAKNRDAADDGILWISEAGTIDLSRGYAPPVRPFSGRPFSGHTAHPFAGFPPPRDVIVLDADDSAFTEQLNAREMRIARFRSRRRMIICVLLFLATTASTFLVGSNFAPLSYIEYGLRLAAQDGQAGDSIARELQSRVIRQQLNNALLRGFWYSLPMMMILLCHEMGHYLQAVRHRIPASLPFFIPLPLPPLGTMGAVIFQGRGSADRKQMFDIAVSGPLAGLLVTFPVLYFGIKESHYVPIQDGTASGFEFGKPLMIQWFIDLLHSPCPPGQTFDFSGLAQAGWVGVFITAMNLLPIGQLDGGHILYTLVGKRAHWIARLAITSIAAMMLLMQTYSYFLLLILLSLTGIRHPPTADDSVPLGFKRHVIGWVTMAFFVVGFTPTPIALRESVQAEPEPPADQQPSQPVQPTQPERVDPRSVNPHRLVLDDAALQTFRVANLWRLCGTSKRESGLSGLPE